MSEKVKCKYCDKEYTAGRIDGHEKKCPENPENKVKETKTEEEVKVEEKEEVKVVEAKKDEKDVIIEKQADELTTLRSEFSKMQGMMELLLKQGGMSQPQSVVVSQEEEYVNVFCNDFNDITIVLDKNREITFKANKIITLTTEDVRKISQNRKLSKYFEKGIFQFEDDKWYKKFRIEKAIPLDDEHLAELLASDRVVVLEGLDKITDYKKSFDMYNMVLFRICKMVKEAKYPEIMKNWTAFDEYFEGKLGYANAMAEAFQ